MLLIVPLIEGLAMISGCAWLRAVLCAASLGFTILVVLFSPFSPHSSLSLSLSPSECVYFSPAGVASCSFMPRSRRLDE